MKIRFLVVLGFLAGHTFLAERPLHGQPLGTIAGRVRNAQDREVLANVDIVLVGDSIGDVTDSSGVYRIDVQGGRYSLMASIIGFESQTVKNVELKPGEVKVVNFRLEPTFIQLNDVRIEADRLWDNYLTEASIVAVKHLRAEEMISIPAAFDDPMRAAQIFSGVAGAGDYSGFLAVRGGSPDQNQVIMDGMVVPNPYRFRLAFGGGLSAINPNTTEDMYLHLGGFSAEYGNSLSSILEVQSTTGDRDRMRAQGSLNFTDVSGTLEGPIPTGIGSYVVSVRRTYYDLIIDRFSNSTSVFPFFLEVNGKVDLDIGPSNKVGVRFTRNKEGTELRDELSENVNLDEGAISHLASISWRKLAGDRLQFHSALSFYADKLNYRAFDTDSLLGTREYESIDSQVKQISFRHRIRYKSGESSWLTWGVAATRIPSRIAFNSADLSFLYGRVETPTDVDFDRNQTYYETFLESATSLNDQLHIQIGARYDYSTLIREGELSPRFSIWYGLSDRLKFNGSWGVFYQYPNPMSIYTRNIPVDLSQNLRQISAEKAIHQMLGIEATLKPNLIARLQVYNNDIDRLLLPADEFRYLPRNHGVGFSRGFELILEKKADKVARLSGLLSYSFNRAQYRDIDSDEWQPFKYDRRHALTGLLNIRLFGNWSFSALGQFSTGYPFTNVLGMRQILDGDGLLAWDFVRDKRMGSRFPSLKKLDVRLSYQRSVEGRSFSFYLDLINVTNERNIQEITWEKQYLPDETQQATKRVIYMLPLIPSFGISFKM